MIITLAKTPRKFGVFYYNLLSLSFNNASSSSFLESFSFDDIYNHELLRKLRYLLLSSKKMPKVCKNCFYGE
jgi:hypothetical protein